MSSKKLRKKLKTKKEKIEYLHAWISWGWALKSFKIINGDNYETITERNLEQNGKQCWFNITNIKKEINEYSNKLGLKTDLGELFVCIDEQGLSYSDLDPHFDRIKQKAKERSIILIN